MSMATSLIFVSGIFCKVLLVALFFKAHVRGSMSFWRMTLELEATNRPRSEGQNKARLDSKK